MEHNTVVKKQTNDSTTVDLRSNLFILSAPSGTGKNTVFNVVKKRNTRIERAVTVTTRPIRGNDKDGIDYYFLSEQEFFQKRDEGLFVEWNYFDSGYYATLYSEIEKHPQLTPVFLIVDTNGMKEIMVKYPNSTSIFLTPPSMEELKKRIEKRGENTPEETARRMNTALAELEQSHLYDFVIENTDTENTAHEIIRIVQNKSLI